MLLFTLLAALSAWSAPAMRPELSSQVKFTNRQLHSQLPLKDIALLRDRVEELVEAGMEAAWRWVGLPDAKSQTDSLLVQAKKQADDLIVQAANATRHMDSDEEDTLRSVVTVINTTIYSSMDQSHEEEQFRLNHAAEDIDSCNAAVAVRLGQGGDLYDLEQKCRGFQSELNELRGSITELNFTNQSAWQHLFFFVKFLPHAPPCPSGYQSKTIGDIGEFLADEDYKESLERQKNWYADVEVGFQEKYREYQDANSAILSAQEQIIVDKESLRIEFCVWQFVLTAGCQDFDECYQQKVEYFNEVVKTARKNEQTRIEAYRAGESVLAHVKFLLGTSDFPEKDVPVDTSRYQLHYPMAPAQGSCEVVDVASDPFWDDDLACNGPDPVEE